MIGLAPRGGSTNVPRSTYVPPCGDSTNVLLPKSRRMVPEWLQNVVIASSYHLAGVVVHLYHYLQGRRKY